VILKASVFLVFFCHPFYLQNAPKMEPKWRQNTPKNVSRIREGFKDEKNKTFPRIWCPLTLIFEVFVWRVVKNHMFTHFSCFFRFYQKSVQKVTKFGIKIDLKSAQKVVQKRASIFITFLIILGPQKWSQNWPMSETLIHNRELFWGSGPKPPQVLPLVSFLTYFRSILGPFWVTFLIIFGGSLS